MNAATGRAPVVTSDTEARSDEADVTADHGSDPTLPELTVATAAASRFVKTAAGFLGLGMLLVLILAIKRVAPDFLGGVAFLSYGRLVPAATTLLLYGWLTIGLLGALLFIVPRAARSDFEDGAILRAALGLLALAYIAGAVAVLAGYTEGRRYLEAPLVIDLVSLVGLVGVARAITRVARKAPEAVPEVWYSAAAVIWLVLAHIVGNIPGLTGYAGQLQTSFYRSSLIGLWLASATVAVAYYVIPRLGGRPPLRATRLSVLGIWSLGFIWAMTAPAELTFGAAGDWLETIGVIFSIVLFLPIVVIATDLTHAMRGGWRNVRDRTGLRFIMAGLAMVAIYAVFNLTQALRASAAVVGFTDWVAAQEVLVLFGPFTFVLIGFLRLSTTEQSGRAQASGLTGYRVALGGIGLTVAAMAIAGVQTGFTWAGAANTAEFTNFGAGWVSTAGPLEGNYVVQLAGLVVLTVGLGLALRSALGGGSETPAAPASPAIETEPDLVLANPPTLQKVRRYAYGFFILAALIVLVLPALESEEPTLLAESRDYRPGAVATGRAIYVQEGCAYCHTQQVRPIITDVGLGPVSVLGDYANETPALIGVQRYGPDLTHLAERADAVADHLGAPRSERPWSTMPSYDYLSGTDLEALAAYLVGGE